MRSTSFALAATLLALSAPAAAQAADGSADGTVTVGDAVASVHGADVSLRDAHVARRWHADGGAVTLTGLDDVDTGRAWAAPGPDFQVAIDEVTTSSTTGWSLAGVRAQKLRDAAVQLVFRYRLVPADGAGPELTRTFTLYPGSAVIAAATTLASGPTALRVGQVALDQVTSTAPVSAEVETYHGGSDWRDDYRTSATEKSTFDDEAQVARFDDGTGAGWFHVAERRSGPSARAGRDAAGRTWVGVDPARDVFDAGPLKTDPPDYNRVPNPVYPVPVRERTVAPGTTLDLGTAYTGVYHGGAPEAPARFAAFFAAHVAPDYRRSVGINSFHPWNHGDGMSDANLRKQVDAAKALGIETFMLDDQWQGGAGGESGDWNWDPARFPGAQSDDVPDFVDYLHKSGLELGLWMSPLEFNTASQTYAAHPDWACAPTGHLTAQVPDDAGLGVWDVTNPAFQDYLTGVIDRLVRDDDVREFKFDFMAWVDCAPHDYLDYEDAFKALVRRFEARHPNVTFELDETNDQRLWPFSSAAVGPSWFDNGHLHGSTATAKLLHDVWAAGPWMPMSSIGTGLYDGTLSATFGPDFLMPIALLGHVTFWTDLTKLTADQNARTAQWIAWYKRHRGVLGGAAYELTGDDPLSGKGWTVVEPVAGRRAAVFAFRQAGGPDALSVGLRGLKPGTRYVVRRAPEGARVGTFTGAQLTAGLEVELPAEQSATVLTVDPA